MVFSGGYMAIGQHTPHGLQRPHTDTVCSAYVYNGLIKWDQSQTIAALLSCHAYSFLLGMFVSGLDRFRNYMHILKNI